MPRVKKTKYAKLLQMGDKFQQPDSQIENIWTVRRIESVDDELVKVFVANRHRAFVLGANQRVSLHYK